MVRALDAIAVSALARVEVPSALWRKHRLGELTAEDAGVLSEAFRADFLGAGSEAPRFAVVAVVPRLLEHAASLAAAHSLRAYDAVQLASAVAARDADASCTGFVCFDATLCAAAAAHGLTVIPEPQRRAPAEATSVAIVGGGVVGAAVAHALARRGVAAVLLEAEDELALGASGTNSGILHTAFDSPPGELETELILRSTALRDDVTGVPVLRCGAVLSPRGGEEAGAVAALVEGARRNGVTVELRADGALHVPGEAVTDPVAYTLALAGAAGEVRTGARVTAIRRAGGRLVLDLAGGGAVTCDVAVNCAGLHADEVARLAGDASFEVYPRKGEFFVFDATLNRILLPVPSKRTKGVLVFPTIDGKVVAGPTAHDQVDKADWSVRPEARDEVLGKARALLPALEGAEPIAAYAGLRPAGRGANYVIGPSAACPGLVNVAAIRSTGLSASLGIGEHVAGLVGQLGVALGPVRPVPLDAPHGAPRRPPATPPPVRSPHPDPLAPEQPWWRRAALRRVRSA